MKAQRTMKWSLRRSMTGLTFSIGLAASVVAFAHVTVAPPNGTLSAEVVDLSVQASIGQVAWQRTFNVTGWRFNRNWDGISASYKPAMTQHSGGGSPGTTTASGGASAACWIWVDEDWQPSAGVTGLSTGGNATTTTALLPEAYLPLNRSYSQTAVPLDTVITTGFASGCSSIGGNLAGNSSEVLEGWRRQSQLYVGTGGTYIFKNRYILRKQAVQKLASVGLPVGGSVPLGGAVSIASGWRRATGAC